MTRRTKAMRRGQLWISEEIRFAPLPVRLWPLAIRQMDLFSD